MRKALLIFFLSLFLLTSVQTVSAEEITDFHSQIAIQKDGKIRVEEKIIYDFGRMEKHGTACWEGSW